MTMQKAAALGLLDTAADTICNVQCAWLSGMCSTKAVHDSCNAALEHLSNTWPPKVLRTV